MIAKLIGYLDKVRIRGVSTNVPLLKRILQDEIFVQGVYDTTYLPEFLARVDIQALIEEIEKETGALRVAVDANALKIEGTDELNLLKGQVPIHLSELRGNVFRGGRWVGAVVFSKDVELHSDDLDRGLIIGNARVSKHGAL